MTSRRRQVLLALLLTAAVGASGCSTVSRMNPFKGSGGPKETATEGQRISIIPADEILTPAENLKGVDFALPPVATQAEWPLPGGTPEQSVENVNAGANLSIAWRRNIGLGSSKAVHVTATPVTCVFGDPASAAVVLPMVNPMVPEESWTTPAGIRDEWFTYVDAAGARGDFLALLTIWVVTGTVN